MGERVFEFSSIEEIIKEGRELEVIYGCEFDVINNDDGSFSVVDLQGANFGNIEAEQFSSYREILERLEGSYLYDYGYVGLD